MALGITADNGMQALEMGATDYLTKPVNADILLAQLGDEISAIHDVDKRTDVTAKRNANLP